MAYGILFLIPVPLAEDAAGKSFTPYLVDTINLISEYIVENEKTARRFLKEAGYSEHEIRMWFVDVPNLFKKQDFELILSAKKT